MQCAINGCFESGTSMQQEFEIEYKGNDSRLYFCLKHMNIACWYFEYKDLESQYYFLLQRELPLFPLHSPYMRKLEHYLQTLQWIITLRQEFQAKIKLQFTENAYGHQYWLQFLKNRKLELEDVAFVVFKPKKRSKAHLYYDYIW